MKRVLRRDDDYPTYWQQVALVAGGEFPDVLRLFIDLLIPPTLYRAAAAAAVRRLGTSGKKEEYF